VPTFGVVLVPVVWTVEPEANVNVLLCPVVCEMATNPYEVALPQLALTVIEAGLAPTWAVATICRFEELKFPENHVFHVNPALSEMVGTPGDAPPVVLRPWKCANRHAFAAGVNASLVSFE